MKIGEESGVEIMVSQEVYEEMKKEKMIEENKILKELQDRIDKAIEYINNGYLSDGEMVNILAQQELLNILEGDE